MARQRRSLRHNLGFGIDIPNHREHRSKRGRRIRDWDYWGGKVKKERLDKLKQQDYE